MSPTKQPTIEERKRDSLELFEKYLVDVLDLDNELTLEELNLDLVDLLLDDHKFKDNLERALFKNLQKLTHKKFVLDGKPHAPSVRNWLRDFVKRVGTSYFDNVTLSQYITSSPNAKILDEEERKKLHKLLIIYRNIRFFYKLASVLPPEKLKIIPIKEEDYLEKARTVSGPPKTEEEKKIEKLKELEKRYSDNSLEKRVIDEQIEKEEKINALKYLASQYSENSLERKAIEEEIKKMES